MNDRDKPHKPKEKAQTAAASPGCKPGVTHRTSFPMIAMGSSAGGLEAMEQFLGAIPPDTPVAVFIVSHLDPTHKGMMPELLQRSTTMSVVQAKDATKVQPRFVYVIPPNKDMSILHGRLHLFDPTESRGLRLPIDFFFRSFADDLKEECVAVVLSGMGSDGSLGARAVKEKGGLILAQEPSSAKFDSMPRSVIDAGLADIVAVPGEMPGKILDYLKHAPHPAQTAPVLTERTQSGLDKTLILLRVRTGHDFSGYKKSTIYRRIERRMAIHQISDIAAYVRYLQENAVEVELLFKELLIGVTSFFRDASAWTQLCDKALTDMIAGRTKEGVLRSWVPGCSTGEEAYSLAIVFRELIAKLDFRFPVTLQIFATDLDAEAIDKARQGLYPLNIAADVSPERLATYFDQEDTHYRVGKKIREMVVFAAQNVIGDPPFTKMDLVCCRNLLIYLETELQQKLLATFHYSLNPGGALFLGSAETVGAASDLFAPLHAKARFYRRVDVSTRAQPAEIPRVALPLAPGRTIAAQAQEKTDLQSLADKLLLKRFAPASVLVNGSGDIVYINGKTGKYLEPPSGKANWNILAMARDGLAHELAAIFQRVVRNRGEASAKNVKIPASGGPWLVDVSVQAIDEPEALRGMVLVVFTDTPGPERPERGKRPRHKGSSDSLLKEAEFELQKNRETLQMTMEEMQASQEELKSTNEELQSTNEELQSTNEELTTSREEMQSLNEELQTVNNELQAKLDELSKTNDDMQNLLNSTEIATIFLDDFFKIRSFTPQAAKITKLIPSDVGRPLADLVTDLEYPQLYADASEVLRTLVFSEKQVPTRGGRWFSVRIMPYRTRDNRIDGVVITLMDITPAKHLELQLVELNAEQKKRLFDK